MAGTIGPRVRLASMLLALLLSACGAIVLASPAAAQFVTITAMPGEVSAVAVSGNIYVARDSFPSVLVYDSQTLQLLAEVSLLSLDTNRPLTAVTALAVARDGSILCGSAPHGTIYSIQGINARRVGQLPAITNGDTITRITALHVNAGGTIYAGGTSGIPGTRQALFRGSYNAGLMALTRVDFPDSRVFRVNDFASHDHIVAVATSDSPDLGPARRGRLWLYDASTGGLAEAWNADSAVTATTAWRVNGRDAILAAGSPSGRIRDSFGIQAAAVPDSVVHVLQVGSDGRETVVWVGAETGMLRKISSLGIQDVAIPIATLNSIIDIAPASGPDRTWMVGRGAGGSFLFYFDSAPPRVNRVLFTIETGLRQPYTSDTFQPPLTSGRYFVRIQTDEKLRSAPDFSIIYADGSVQVINLAGSHRDWSAEIVIDSTRAIGTVTVVFAGADDAGNTGTVILTGSSFALRTFGRVVVANNLIRPNFGEFATVRYVLTSQQNVTVRVYNLRGQMVADLSPGTRGPGEFRDVVWRGRNADGNLVASGVYLLRFMAGDELQAVQKIMVVR